MNSYVLFIFNVFFNSILAFFTAVFLAEGIIFLFRMRQGRCVAFLRMIPILKLPVDLFLYDFTKWAYMHGINPLTCEEGSRTLSAAVGFGNSVSYLLSPIYSMIQFTTPENKTFTLADLLSHFISPFFLKLFVFVLIGGSLACLLRKIWIYRRFVILLKFLERRKEKSKIKNRRIKEFLSKRDLLLITSSNFKGSPFVAGVISPTIYLPSTLSEILTEKEYEAVLAHEVEHIRNKDMYVRLMLEIIESIFWWIPTKWLRKQIEEGQEVSCDLQCKKYGVNPLDLASALYKSAKAYSKGLKPTMTHQFTKYRVQRRVKILLHCENIRFQKFKHVFSCRLLIVAFFIILLGRFWIF